MKSLKLNFDMNIVNCVLLFIVLIFVLLFSNKQSDNFYNFVEKGLNPNCNSLNPCRLYDENNKQIKWSNESEKLKCNKYKFDYPLNIANEELKPNNKFNSAKDVENYLLNKFKKENPSFTNDKIKKLKNYYIGNLKKKSCRGKNDDFCKLRYIDRFTKKKDKQSYLIECNNWKFTEDKNGHEIRISNNGEDGSVCKAPKGLQCGI